MLGLAKAVERLAHACTEGETVLVHGDYDVDGICSTTIMTKTLREFGAKVSSSARESLHLVWASLPLAVLNF